MRFFDPFRPQSRPIRVGIAAILASVLVLSSIPGAADLADDLEKLRQEQATIQQNKKDKAAEVDLVSAEAAELASALEVVNADVNEQATKVAAAERTLVAAQDRHDVAVLTVVEHQTTIDDLELRLSSQAISSFINQNEARSPILEEIDPNLAVRMQSLTHAVTEDGITVSDDLRGAKEDLEIEQKVAADASGEAEAIQAAMAADLEELERRQARQAELWQAAEDRLEHNLSEAAALADIDAELSAKITKKNEELIRQTQVRRPPTKSGGTTSFPSASEIVKVSGFWVHRDIAVSFEAMMNHAAADGVNLGGGAYRDSASQIRLRKAHCGTSNYAVYQMRASQCRPPTARPGASMHEQGKAIDFQYGGRIIGSRSNAGYKWLAANAAAYGFYNLPSEPWHWSVNGR